jgi:hypothetical protein
MEESLIGAIEVNWEKGVIKRWETLESERKE